jgi:hypothetical protein
MKGKRTTSEFSRKDYVRPNQDWVCGHLCKGEACRIGPSPKGKCRVTYECVPLLDLKPGETKGHYKCTRPPSAGGKCDRGPMPDGTCCNAVPKCQPRRTLRNIRKRVIAFTIIASVLVLIIGLSRQTREKFTNPGPLSAVHTSKAFDDAYAKIHAEKRNAANESASTCAACHEGARQGIDSWSSKAFDAFAHGLAPAELIRKGPMESSPMDKNCLACHGEKDFHQPNMPTEFACHECHKEHGSSDFMPEVNSTYCTACHGSPDLMAKSRELTASVNPHSFPNFQSNSDVKVQPRERPEGGYTEVITAFHIDHPDSRLTRNNVKDVNPLKFNHQKHLGAGFGGHEDNPTKRELSCKDCHERDGTGEYQLPITYEKHCVACHALKFDQDTPGLHLPHGDPYYVRAFLRSLNIQYEEYARSQEGIALPDALNEYVTRKKVSVEKSYGTGEFLERAVFFAGKDKRIPGGRTVPYEGCATCHEVMDPEGDNAAPMIKKVSVPVRWMVLGQFNHEVHQKGLDCLDCHKVKTSAETSDLNLPPINTPKASDFTGPAFEDMDQARIKDLLATKACVECHSPAGGIDHRCTSCHSYHNTKPSVFLPAKASEPAGGDDE